MRLRSSADPRLLTRRHACSGPGSSWVLSPPGLDAPAFLNAEWIMAIRYRLGLVQYPDGSLCQLEFCKDERLCGKDFTDVHAVSCRAGLGISRLHNGLLQVLFAACNDAGLHTRKEQVVPHWSSLNDSATQSSRLRSRCRYVEAILDVTAQNAVGECYYIDVTVRNPDVKRYQTPRARLADGTAASVPGFACRVAEDDKIGRYPGVGGAHVIPVAAKTYGRISERA